MKYTLQNMKYQRIILRFDKEALMNVRILMKLNHFRSTPVLAPLFHFD